MDNKDSYFFAFYAREKIFYVFIFFYFFVCYFFLACKSVFFMCPNCPCLFSITYVCPNPVQSLSESVSKIFLFRRRQNSIISPYKIKPCIDRARAETVLCRLYGK